MIARRTDRAERLLDLVSLFLAADEPVTWMQLQDAFPGDYAAGTPESCLRKWERDKAELVELGVPLSWVQGNEDVPDGYVVDRQQYYLKDLDLAPQEVALLSLAGAAALREPSFPLRADLSHALDKLVFAAGDRAVRGGLALHLPAPGAAQQTGVLEALGRGVAARKDVTFTYRSFAGDTTRRTVSPYGLAYRRGAWFLAGFCHLRQDLRTFQVERITELSLNEAKPRHPDFEVPAGFDVSEHVGREPWQFAVHAPLTVVLRLDPGVALLARSRFGPAADLEADDDGGVRVTLAVTNRDAVVREVLSLSPHAELLEPFELRRRVGEAAARIAAAHDEGEAP
jgi:predicted DNA-binding transcriptional regulator YafY